MTQDSLWGNRYRHQVITDQEPFNHRGQRGVRFKAISHLIDLKPLYLPALERPTTPFWGS